MSRRPYEGQCYEGQHYESQQHEGQHYESYYNYVSQMRAECTAASKPTRCTCCLIGRHELLLSQPPCAA